MYVYITVIALNVYLYIQQCSCMYSGLAGLVTTLKKYPVVCVMYSVSGYIFS